MKILEPLIVVGLILLGGFTFINWSVLSATTPLSFVAFSLEAPMGLVLLGIILGFVALFTVYVLILRTTMLMDARRYARDNSNWPKRRRPRGSTIFEANSTASLRN